MDEAAGAVRDMVDRETEAWNRQDADALVALFHPDMVWPWPPTADSHDPITWVMPMGRFHPQRWHDAWKARFDSHDLVRNDRRIRRIEVTPDGDGGFAVVDIDTVWRRRADGTEDAWTGRVCKVYTRTVEGWKLIMHTGVLAYG